MSTRTTAWTVWTTAWCLGHALNGVVLVCSYLWFGWWAIALVTLGSLGDALVHIGRRADG